MKKLLNKKSYGKVSIKNMKEELQFLWKYFKWLPTWVKPLIIILVIILKFVLPDVILVVGLYKIAKIHVSKKNITL